MINNKISRRSLIKTGATATAVIGVGMSMGMSASANVSNSGLTATAGDLSAQAYAGLGVQEQYVFNVLAKNFKGSSKVGEKEFKSFAQQFVTAYEGPLNLLDNYSGINGEYQLVRQFVKSSS